MLGSGLLLVLAGLFSMEDVGDVPECLKVHREENVCTKVSRMCVHGVFVFVPPWES